MAYRVEIAKNAQEDGQRGQPLQAVDHFQDPVHAGTRPSRQARRRPVALDEQHGAEEIIVAVVPALAGFES